MLTTNTRIMKFLFQISFFIASFISFAANAQKTEEIIALSHAQLDSNHFYKAFDILQRAAYKAKLYSKTDGQFWAEKAKVLDKGRLFGWYREMYDYPPAPGVDTAAIIARLDKDWESTMDTYTSAAMKGDKNYALAYEMRASLEISRKDFAAAAQDLAKAMELDPNNCHAYFTRGNLYRNASKWDSAIVDLTKYIQCEPGNFSAYLKRSVCYTATNKFDLAAADLDESLKLNPGTPASYSVQIAIAHSKAVASRNMIDFDKAAQIAKSVVKKFPNDTSIAKQLNEIYLNRIRMRSDQAKALIRAIYDNDTKAALQAIPLITDQSELNMDFLNPKYKRKEDHALTFAVATNNYELAEALLKAGANPDVVSDREESSLYKLGWMNQWPESDIIKMARLLFQYKANPDLKDETGNTALYGAIVYERVAYARELLQRKANVNLKNNNGVSAISQVQNGSETGSIMMKLLIDAGADVNIANNEKNVGPFMNAAFTSPCSLQSIYLLVKAGVKEIYPNRKYDFADLKAFVSLLKTEVIGKPAAELFESMIVQDVTKFKAALKKAAPSDSLINYLYLANMGGPYNPDIETELRHEGASDVFSMYNIVKESSMSVGSMKKERFGKVTGDGYEMYYNHEQQQIIDLAKESEVNFDKLNRHTLVGTNNCGLLIDNYNISIRMIRIMNQILKNHSDGIFKLTDKRKAEGNKIIATLREAPVSLKQSMSKYGCSTNGLLVE